MPTQKKVPKKAKSQAPKKSKLCLRQIDQNTSIMSDDESFPKATKIMKGQETPKGMKRIDSYNMIPS